MEKVIYGYMDKVPIRMKLPVSITSPAVPKVSAVKPSSASVSEEARVKVISLIVNKKRSYNDHQYPDFAHPVWSKELQEECHDVFKQLLDKHPFPLSQGPIVLPLDSLTSCLSEYRSRCEESVAKVLNDKTVFRHDESQDCGKWIPQIVGVASWAAEHDSGGGNAEICVKAPAGMREARWLVPDVARPVQPAALFPSPTPTPAPLRNHLLQCSVCLWYAASK